MKIFNIIVTIFCVLLIFIAFYMSYGLEFEREHFEPGENQAQAGMGIGITLMIYFALNSILTGILFLSLLITALVKGKIKNIYVLVNLLLIIFTFFLPIYLP